jgi:hypothetical protein
MSKTQQLLKAKKETIQGPASLPMRRGGIIVAVTVVALGGCSDNLAPNIEACKAKATETQVPKQELSKYVSGCMRAQGWTIKDACADTPDRWDSSECYLR